MLAPFAVNMCILNLKEVEFLVLENNLSSFPRNYQKEGEAPQGGGRRRPE